MSLSCSTVTTTPDCMQLYEILYALTQFDSYYLLSVTKRLLTNLVVNSNTYLDFYDRLCQSLGVHKANISQP